VLTLWRRLFPRKLEPIEEIVHILTPEEIAEAEEMARKRAIWERQNLPYGV